GAERKDDLHARQERHFAGQKRRAAGDLRRGRAVLRRRAPDREDDERVVELEAVVRGGARWLARESGPVEGGVEEVPRAVPCKDAPGAVRAVRPRREANDREARLGIAEAWHGLSPVRLFSVGTALRPRDLLTPGNEARAGAAGDDFAVQLHG